MDVSNIGNNWEEAGKSVGNFSTSAQKNLMKAFSLNEGDDNFKTQLSNLKRSMGIDQDTNLDGVRLIAQQKYEQAMRAVSTLSRILSNMHQMIMSIIGNIRVR